MIIMVRIAGGASPFQPFHQYPPYYHPAHPPGYMTPRMQNWPPGIHKAEASL